MPFPAAGRGESNQFRPKGMKNVELTKWEQNTSHNQLITDFNT